MVVRVFSCAVMVMLGVGVTGSFGVGSQVQAAASEIVLYASEASVVRGNWAAASSSGAAGSRSMKSGDQGFATPDQPLASPSHYFEATFDAPAATTYRVWLRLRAANNSKWNDAVWVQFSDSLNTSGATAYRVGTTNGLMVNLERCAGCGTANWGWQNTAYWLRQATQVRFATTGKHTIRIQTREDGVEVDQVVLSPVKFLSSAPGAVVNDATILAKAGSTTTSTTTTTSSQTPYKGTPFALPGTINAADFDNGGESVSYSDTTRGNAGTVYRQTDVDLQGASVGGYNVGWTEAGEWLQYTVNVASAATYNLQLRVAATAANSVNVSSGSANATVSVPNTGGWQAWQVITVPITLAAGQQVMTVKFTTGGVNLRSITIAPRTTTTTTTTTPTSSGSGGAFRMMTWNIHHGKRKDGVYDPVGQARLIAAQNPHVVVLQEVQTWTDNQPSRYKALLEQLTGVTWRLQWAPVVNSTWTEGNVVLTRLPVVSSSSFQMHATGDWTALLANRSVAQATVTVGGVPVHVFSTHLDYANSTYRTAQLQDLMEWTDRFSGKQVVGGDFNSTPGTYWITTMGGDYYDTWQDVTGSTSGGGTINGVRFDYLFRRKSAANSIRPTSVRVVSTTLSDHLPVVADYTVTP